MRVYILGQVEGGSGGEGKEKQKSGAKNKPSKMSRLSFLLLIVHRQASNVAEIRLYKVYLEH